MNKNDQNEREQPKHGIPAMAGIRRGQEVLFRGDPGIWNLETALQKTKPRICQNFWQIFGNGSVAAKLINRANLVAVAGNEYSAVYHFTGY